MSLPRGYRANARYTVQRLGSSGYQVLDPLGRRVGEAKRFRIEAETLAQELQRQADSKVKRGARDCLCCGATFESSGIGNRLCPHCRQRDAGDGSHSFALPKGHKRA